MQSISFIVYMLYVNEEHRVMVFMFAKDNNVNDDDKAGCLRGILSSLVGCSSSAFAFIDI
jgi:hypothetical protein